MLSTLTNTTSVFHRRPPSFRVVVSLVASPATVHNRAAVTLRTTAAPDFLQTTNLQRSANCYTQPSGDSPRATDRWGEMNAMSTIEQGANIPVGCGPSFRESLCIATKTEILRPTDPGFREEVSHTLGSAESWMLEKTVQLKHRLRGVTTYDFWQLLMEGMTEITGSQYAFVAKRVLYDDEDKAVEIPLIGEPASCLMGLAFYFDDHKGTSVLYRDYKYHTYGCPCQWMRHDRVLLIPDGLTALTPDNPSAQGFPIPAEGYLAVPLFHEGKCYAHFGCMWTANGLKERPKLSWALLEMFLHALEDQVGARVLEGLGLGKPKSNVIPQNLVSGRVAVKHSLRPYARRLSHELRTPMQGVVGMLDVMYASVVEATHPDRWRWPDLAHLKEVIEGLRASIEVAQGSYSIDILQSRRLCADSNLQIVPSVRLTRRTIWCMHMISTWRFRRRLHGPEWN